MVYNFIFTIYWKSFKSQIPYKIEEWLHILYQTMVNDPDTHSLLRLIKSLNYHIIFTSRSSLNPESWKGLLSSSSACFPSYQTPRYAQAIVQSFMSDYNHTKIIIPWILFHITVVYFPLYFVPQLLIYLKEGPSPRSRFLCLLVWVLPSSMLGKRILICYRRWWAQRQWLPTVAAYWPPSPPGSFKTSRLHHYPPSPSPPKPIKRIPWDRW